MEGSIATAGAQIEQALEHAHSCGVLQVDIGPHNVLLDWAENVKLTDFAGSSIDGSAPLVEPSPHFEHPSMPATNLSPRSEIFALGSTIYELDTTSKPYEGKADKEIERLFSAQDFPDTSTLVLGEAVTKCWKAEYKNIGEAREDIMRIQKKFEEGQRAWWGKR
jgi:serine/threonine protein kinase